ncbi:MAG: HK97 family phage prohead protease [Novosphingobium sp.]|nr:HK97 family phage prohead protease [Novosphingobium sp.]
MNYLTKSIDLDLKSLTDTGRFSGYGSVFGNVDKGGDVVEFGAFGKSLELWGKSGRSVPTLWQHKTDEPIGAWSNLTEDKHGLLGDSDLWIDDAPYARIAHKGMKTKTITGLSIGYRIKRDSYNKKTGITTLHELDLVEISVVTNPMNDAARMTDVKSMIEAGTLPTLREFEDFLRDAGGFSKSQAEKIATRGLQPLLRGDPDSVKGDDLSAVLALFQSVKI